MRYSAPRGFMQSKHLWEDDLRTSQKIKVMKVLGSKFFILYFQRTRLVL
jgi:hypothetical protein